MSLSLQDVGDLIYKTSKQFMLSKGSDVGADITMLSGPLQESMTLRLPNEARLLVKTFPHKSFSGQLVYRIEGYKTREGDLRGNRIAFLEAQAQNGSADEICQFVQSLLSQLGY